MRWAAPIGGAVCLLLSVFAASSPAHRTQARTRASRTTTLSLVASGSLAYEWQASSALGCAAEHLCGVDGAAIVTVHGATLESAPDRRALLDLTAGVTMRTLGPQPYAACTDELPVAALLLHLDSARARQDVRLTGFGFGLPSAGRCSGPLEPDLERLRIPVRRSGSDFDLSGDAAETAGPFDVRLVSTLTLRPGTVTGSSGSITGSFFPGTPVKPKPGPSPRVYVVTERARYRVIVGSGALLGAFRAGGGPFCGALGSCGTSGTLSVAIVRAVRAATFDLQLTSPDRLDGAQIRAALRRATVEPRTLMTAAVRVTETVHEQGTGMCSSSRVEDDPLATITPRVRTVVALGAGSSGPSGAGVTDALRTYCPGPANQDLLGSSPFNDLAAGSTTIGASSIALRLRHRGRVGDDYYSTVWSGSLPITLKLIGSHVSERVT